VQLYEKYNPKDAYLYYLKGDGYQNIKTNMHDRITPFRECLRINPSMFFALLRFNELRVEEDVGLRRAITQSAYERLSLTWRQKYQNEL
jgi:hypothetical protein